MTLIAHSPSRTDRTDHVNGHVNAKTTYRWQGKE